MPDGTRCSAHTTAPLPPSSRKPPTTAALRQCVTDGAAAPRSRAHPKSSAPAMTKRAPAMRNGGSVSMA